MVNYSLTTLTGYGAGIAQDRMKAERVANFLAPEVETGVSSGYYNNFANPADFQTYDTRRALGGAAKRVMFISDTPAIYDCTPNALERPIDDAERRKLNGADATRFEQSQIRMLVNVAYNSHVDQVVKKAAAAFGSPSLTATGWGGSDDPVAQIDALMIAMSKVILRVPNRLLFTIESWNLFRNNAAVKARLGTSGIQTVSIEQAQGLFLFPVKIEISEAYIAAVPLNVSGASGIKEVVKSSVASGYPVYLFYAQNNPDQFDQSFMKTFRVQSGGVMDQVTSYRDQPVRSDVYAIDWTNDIRVTSLPSARQIVVTG